MKENFRGKAEFFHTSVSSLEIGPRGISKAVGVEKLVEYLGLQMDQVIAFGDYDNDVDLIAKAGLGIAVGNATDKLKASADLVIGACSEDGPAKFLHEVGLNEAMIRKYIEQKGVPLGTSEGGKGTGA